MTTAAKAPRKFAAGTVVNRDTTVNQIRDELRRRKVDGFRSGEVDNRAQIDFRHAGRVYRFDLELPLVEEYRRTAQNVRRSESAMVEAWGKECDRRYRALLLTIKGRLVAVDEEIVAFEDEFVMEAVMADGKTVRQFLKPQIDEMYATGRMPPLLPAPN